MLRVKEGDLDKLGQLFERYKKPLFGFFYGMNKDVMLSEDLVQNVFVRVLRYRNVFRGDGEFRTWIFHIARNVRIDHFRKEKIKSKDSLEHWENQLTVDDDKVSTLQKEEELMLLTMAMDRLPEDKREVLLLSRFQEKKYKEIGEIIGCSEGAVKVKVFRALQELKTAYHELESKL